MSLILRKLNAQDSQAFFNALRDWDSHPDFLFAQGYQPTMTFQDYLDLLAANENGKRLPVGYVPASSLCGFVGNTIVGRVSIRHELNDFLFKVGGHIGYGVLPTFRQKGYAKAMLSQALDYARNLGLDKTLLTCDPSNIASIKTIESCGGVYENKLETNGVSKLRYWITVTHPQKSS